MVPNVLTLRAMGLLNTIWAVVLPMWFTPFYIFLVRQFMVSLPGELIEAASIDGAGTFRTYIHIVLPVCQAILGAAAALSFADCWNLVEQPLTYLTERADIAAALGHVQSAGQSRTPALSLPARRSIFCRRCSCICSSRRTSSRASSSQN